MNHQSRLTDLREEKQHVLQNRVSVKYFDGILQKHNSRPSPFSEAFGSVGHVYNES